MTGALVILLAMIVVGFLLYITDRKYFRHHHDNQPGEVEKHSSRNDQNLSSVSQPDVCCGMHLVCEKTSLAVVSDEIVYYDDEELDRFAGRLPESYSIAEKEEFRDVLLTLLPQDIPGWAKSITLRKIELPSEIKDELLLLITDLRANPSL